MRATILISALLASSAIAQPGANTIPPPSQNAQGDDERIALDVLPPAISAANESGAEAEAEAPVRAPRARRPRRPREDDDIAPAA